MALMTKAVSSPSLQFYCGAGHASVATVTNMKKEDTVVHVLQFLTATGVWTDDITSTCSVLTSADASMTVPSSATSTLAVWYHSAAGEAAHDTFPHLCLKSFLADGAAGTTGSEVLVTGLKTTDHIISALHLTTGGDFVVAEYTPCVIPSDGHVTSSYGDTSSDKVWFLWHSADGGVGECHSGFAFESFKCATVATATEDITCTGIAVGDHILWAFLVSSAGALESDDTANVSITAANTIRSTTTFGATNKKLYVGWLANDM